MSVQKRRCFSCKYFQDANLSGNGWCTHPKRQVSSDVRILVRKGELACRNSWGGDRWESADADSSSPAPPPVMPGSVFVVNEHTEDQVTSVRASGADTTRTDGVGFSDLSFSEGEREDVIVDHASVLAEDGQGSRSSSGSLRHLADDDGQNIPAQEDQQERAQVIARGSRAAILRARERHTQRRKGIDRLQPPSRQDAEGTETDDSGTQPSDDQVSFTAHPGIDPEAGDSDLTVPGNLRFGRRAHIPNETAATSGHGRSMSVESKRTYDDPTPPVPADDVRRDPQSLVSRKADRDRFETVPEIKPDVELPRIRQFLQPGERPPAGNDPVPGEHDDPGPMSSYDLVLRRARAIKNASKAGRQDRPVLTTAPKSGTPPRPAERPQSINKRFERINHLPAIDWEVEHDAADVSFAGAQLPDLDGEEVVSGRQNHHDGGYATERRGSHVSDAADEPWFDDEDQVFDEDRDAYLRTSIPVDHRRNWWRGLGFGRNKRQMDNVSADVDDHWYGPEDDSIDADGAFDGADTYDDDEVEVEVEVEEGSAVQAVNPQGPLVAQRSAPGGDHPSIRRGPHLSTSEQLDEIRESSPAAHETQSIKQPSRQTSRSSATGFFLNGDRGMDAYRSALFGDERRDNGGATTSVRSPDERERQRVGTRRQPTHAASVREPRLSSYRPLDEQPLEPPSSHEPLEERWDKPEHNVAFDIRDLVEGRADVLDMTIAVAPHLPRMCQTCRDFRPSESGERGWCTNDWAFTHRQMVNADSLPCQSSIGCWWLPNDASWLPALDPADRRAPTPWTDHLVAQIRGDESSPNRELQELSVREI